jgi:hypothetical protein
VDCCAEDADADDEKMLLKREDVKPYIHKIVNVPQPW